MTVKRGSRSPYMPFYGDDFFGSQKVMLMSPAAVGAYLRLLWLAWRDGSLPSDQLLLARLSGMGPDEFGAIWGEIRDCWEDRDGRLVQPHLESIRASAEALRSRRSDAGKAGNDARWGSQTDRKAIANGSQPCDPVGSLPIPIPSPIPFPSTEGIPPTPLEDGGGTGSTGGKTSDPDGRGAPRETGGREEAKTMDEILLASAYRSHSRPSARNTAIFRAVLRFQKQNGTIADLRELVARSTKGRDPGALLAFWLDKDEWRKELSKR